MKNQWIFLTLTAINFALLALLLLLPYFTKADAAEDTVLRGAGIEIVDRNGRLRAQLVLEPENPGYEWPDGRIGYPETVILRLITADGKPRVKITTSDEDSGLMLLGASDTTHTILKAFRDETSLLLRNDATAQRLLTPGVSAAR